jgi:hypothetical protein
MSNPEDGTNNVLRTGKNYLPKDTASRTRRFDSYVACTCSFSLKDSRNVHEVTKGIYRT